MRIGLTDFSDRDYTVATPLTNPLGGTQSAACYLCRCLAELGHEVFLVNRTTTQGRIDGVEHLTLDEDRPEQFGNLKLHTLVVVQQALHGKYLKAAIGTNVRLVLWAQDAAGEPLTEPLNDSTEREAFDGMAMVSDWQLAGHHQQFGIGLDRMRVLRNAIGPAFMNLYQEGQQVLSQKTWPPILAYTSAPYRGLSLLLDAFPRIRDSVPGTRLRVFSSMKVYQQSAQVDADKYGALYQRCREMEGVEYIGGLPQPQLAQSLMEVSLLAYANIFTETSSIAVMEAMAAGCRIVTTDRGALSETCGGFGRLVSFDQSSEEFVRRYADEVVAALREMRDQGAKVEELLRRQVDWVNRECVWKKKAQEWTDWLARLPGRPSRLTLVQLREGKEKLLQGDIHFRAGRLQDAMECCRQVLAHQPDNARALYLSGMVELHAGRNQSAVQALRGAVAGNSSAASYHSGLALAHAATENYAAAIDEFLAAILLQPHNPEAYNNLGIVLYKTGELDDALLAFGKAIAQRPAYAEAHTNIGNVEMARGNWQEAIAAYQIALAHRPDYLSAQRNLEVARQRFSA